MINYDCMGLPMQQQPGVIAAFSDLLTQTRPDRIIELGTGSGGLTVFFGLYGHMCGAEVYSFDTVFPKDPIVDLLCELGVNLLLGDVFHEEHTRVHNLIKRRGICLVLCDDGDKRREFNRFALYLKPGDIIMAHDYWHDHRLFPTQFTGDGACEISYQDIVTSCKTYHLQSYMGDTFRPLLWACRRRERIDTNSK